MVKTAIVALLSNGSSWILLAVIVLAVIGSGAGVFLSGVTKGAQIIAENPHVKNVTGQAKVLLKDKIKNSIGLGDDNGAQNSGSTSISSTANSVLVLTSEQLVHKQGEPVKLTASNIGKNTYFSDSNLGLQITNEDMNQTYSVSSVQAATQLQPGQSRTITWHQ